MAAESAVTTIQVRSPQSSPLKVLSQVRRHRSASPTSVPNPKRQKLESTGDPEVQLEDIRSTADVSDAETAKVDEDFAESEGESDLSDEEDSSFATASDLGCGAEEIDSGTELDDGDITRFESNLSSLLQFMAD